MAAPAQVNVLPDDVLAAILELARQEGPGDQERLAFRGHDDNLQDVFHRLSEDQPELRLLNLFVFSTSGPRPYSPTLNNAVSKLQLAGLLGRQNPDYEILYTTPSTTAFYADVLSKRFTREQLSELKIIAHKFLSMVEAV